MNYVSVKFSYLSNPDNFTVPYNDTLFFRFLDKDLKSDGTKANIGVIWKMSGQDKKDLLEYLKTLSGDTRSTTANKGFAAYSVPPGPESASL